ncbi:MAG: acetyltransferase [Bacteroidales bacterium]|nr:acetyltransferase [Bacteroidales bacterium]
MNLVIIGASGFGREIYDLATDCYKDSISFKVKGFIGNDPVNINPENYPPYLGTIEDYIVQDRDVFFCAIGNTMIRKKCVNQILEKGGEFINIISPSAYVSPMAKLGIGIGIKFNSVISPDAEIGDFTFIQSGSVIGHDVRIGSFCQINAISFFAGCCVVEDNVCINAGARLVQNVKIGKGATVGIGSIVLRNVKPNTTVFGMPAKILKI